MSWGSCIKQLGWITGATCIANDFTSDFFGDTIDGSFQKIRRCVYPVEVGSEYPIIYNGSFYTFQVVSRISTINSMSNFHVGGMVCHQPENFEKKILTSETCRLPPAGYHTTPLKINMEHNHGGLEDHFPFYINGWFVGSMLIFQGVTAQFSSLHKRSIFTRATNFQRLPSRERIHKPTGKAGKSVCFCCARHLLIQQCTNAHRCSAPFREQLAHCLRPQGLVKLGGMMMEGRPT